MSRARVLIADDHADMRQQVSDILSQEFEIVAAVSNGQLALDAAVALEPDLVILDISMPVLNGLDAAARMAKFPEPPPVVFLSVHDDDSFFDAARAVGARAYVVKCAIATQLLATVRQVLGDRQTNGAAVSPAIPAAPPA